MLNALRQRDETSINMLRKSIQTSKLIFQLDPTERRTSANGKTESEAEKDNGRHRQATDTWVTGRRTKCGEKGPIITQAGRFTRGHLHRICRMDGGRCGESTKRYLRIGWTGGRSVESDDGEKDRERERAFGVDSFVMAETLCRKVRVCLSGEIARPYKCHVIKVVPRLLIEKNRVVKVLQTPFL